MLLGPRLVESVDAEELWAQRAAHKPCAIQGAAVHPDVEEIGARQCWALTWTHGPLAGSWRHHQAHRKEPLRLWPFDMVT